VTQPRVSVIAIFLDEERFLAEAVESVLAQDFADYELLLVDDGSSDASSGIAQAYAARHPGRVRYLEHPGHANRGMSATRNLGLAQAKGEYVAFIDADDRWRPVKLREQIAVLERHPEVGMVCGTVNYWSSWEGGEDRLVATGSRADVVLLPPATSLALYPLGSAGAPCPSDVMIRRGVIDAVAGFEEHFTGPLQMYEDQAFFAKAYLVAGVYFSGRTWLDYRLHAESCVADVWRAGRYPAVRQYFLEWYSGYLDQREFSGREDIVRAVRKARWRQAHPWAARAERRVRRLAGRLARAR
jgi:glycosyltransferase involved in cell wall biosynthesis